MYDQRDAPSTSSRFSNGSRTSNCLEQVGGIAYLSPLPDAVPSAANLSYYLEIVKEKYLLRKMIHTCTEVVGRVYDYEGEVDALMDEVERDILRISEARVEGNSNNDQGTGQTRHQPRSRISISARACSPALAPASPTWTK